MCIRDRVGGIRVDGWVMAASVLDGLLDLAKFLFFECSAILAAFLRMSLGVFLRLKLFVFLKVGPVSLTPGKWLTEKTK